METANTENSQAGSDCQQHLVRPFCRLHLVLNYKWYDLTESGVKKTEYREMTENWEKKIWKKRDELTHVRFARAYTDRMIQMRIKSIDTGPCPIDGWDKEYYRIHFY